jgi:DNA-binding transcriptional MerR regulator
MLDVPVSQAANSEFRIDELAQRAGTTVRNIRAYQDRGLLPPPRRSGRVGLYSPAHLARLRLIGQLLGRGYTLANIAELLAAWDSGQNLGDLLGREAALTEPWSERPSNVFSLEELAQLLRLADKALGPGNPLDQALADGFVRPAAGGYTVESLRLLKVGSEFIAAGVPMSALLATRRALGDRMAEVAAIFVDLVVTHVFSPLGEPIPADQVPRLAELVRRLRPLVQEAVAAELDAAMERQIEERLSAWLGRLFERARNPGDGSVPG